MSVDHYENFPVASLLCPSAIRPAVAAIYHFARTADDIADEGDAPTAQRLAALADYHEDLLNVFAGQAPGPRWQPVFEALARARRSHQLPLAPLAALLDAFSHDAPNPRHADRASLLWYCDRSANPVGRLLLHLYGIHDSTALAQSDDICTALQLINFWQDLSVDLPRGRLYLPESELQRAGLSPEQLLAGALAPAQQTALRALVRELNEWAIGLMHRGSPLVHRVPGRAGWELRLVVQGGLRVAQKVAALSTLDATGLGPRPRLTAADAPGLLWRAWRMRPALQAANPEPPRARA